MWSTDGSLRSALFGERTAISGGTVLVGIILGIGVGFLTTELNPQAGLNSAEPLGFPGVLFFIVIPIIVGYSFRVNGGILPTFLVSFVPVYSFYGAVRSAPPVVGAINDALPPGSRAIVWTLALFYWLLGIGIALATRNQSNGLTKMLGRHYP